MIESLTLTDRQNTPSAVLPEPALPLKGLVESLLFVADEPVPFDRLATVTQASIDEIESLLIELASEYQDNDRGLRLQFGQGKVQMVSSPHAADAIRRFLDLELTSKLSPAALESLAIVAYLQPVTRAQVEGVRGVNSDSVLRTLVNRGLIEEQGRLDQVGRPIIFGTTFEFLQQFGLSTIEQLPPLQANVESA